MCIFVKRFSEWIGLKQKLDSGAAEPPMVKKRDLWWISYGENIGQEISGKSERFSRPGVVLKKLSHTLFLVAPTTTRTKEGTWYVKIRQGGKDMHVCLHQIRIIDYRRLWSRIGSVDESDFDRVTEAFLNLYSK